MTVAHAEHAAGTELSVPLHSRRLQRVQLVQKMQHLVPAAGLLFGGVQSLMADAHGVELALAVGGIVTSVLLVAAFARHLRDNVKHAAGHAHGIDWMDIFAAGVLLAEAAEKYHVRGHLFRPETLAASVTLAIGLFHGKLAARSERRRSLRLMPDHLYVGRNKFSHFKAGWNDIAEIAIAEHEATIRTHQGKTRRLDFKDLENAPQVRAALEEARRRLAAHALAP